MKHLIIDTSTNLMIIMLHDGMNLIGQKNRLGKSDHQAYIIPLIEELLNENQLTIKDISKIIIGVGPGSYTGLRIGVMTAKMLSYTTNIPVYSISSLQLLTSGYETEVFAWHDARNNLGFSAGYNNAVETIKEDLRNYDDLTEKEKENQIILNDQTIKINGAKVILNSKLVDDIYNLIPNYLRKTEAESKVDKES